jgi:hypothetical protein
MEYSDEISIFMQRIQSDSRIGPSHIAIYMAVAHRWFCQGCNNPVAVKAREMMPLAKVFSFSTYQKRLWELHEFGYFRYEMSYDPKVPSLIYMEGQKVRGFQTHDFEA